MAEMEALEAEEKRREALEGILLLQQVVVRVGFFGWGGGEGVGVLHLKQ